MRVISGKLKGRVLKGYNIEGTRPTMDRIKESLFASIQGYLDGAVVLDLFAGSGNLGIEAISNGAKECYFVDYNRECIKAIIDNIRSFKIEEYCVVMQKDYKEALKCFSEKKIKFDIIFIDPPYKYSIKRELLDILVNKDILHDGRIVVFEYTVSEELDDVSCFNLLKNRKYGDKYIAIYQKVKKN